MKIITISRQFGSGGRELGKRMADILGCDYYDRQIIEQLSSESGLDPKYVNHVLSHHAWNTIPMTYRSSISTTQTAVSSRANLLMRQRQIIEEIAKSGSDCIIVGRDADIILRDYHPFRIFVCADLQARLDRCMRFENKKPPGRLTEKDIKRGIRRIDKNRSQIRELLTGKGWSDGSSFDLTVNSTGWDIAKLAPSLSAFACAWFEQNNYEEK